MISASQSGFDARMSLDQVFGLLQDAITEALGQMGSDNITLRRDYHAMWVFTKHRVQVAERPLWGETVHIHCRVVKSNKIACWFKTDVTGTDGTPRLSSMLECCVLDVESFRFVRLTDIPFVPASEPADTAYKILREPEEHICDFTVVPSLTDMSGHLNNAKAFVPLADSFTRDELTALYASPFTVTIQYLSQALYGTRLQLWRGADPQHFSFAYRKEDGSDAFVGSVVRAE